MPGSPAISSTEPRTKPPPVTRSSSGTPEGRRGASWVSPVSGSSANTRPLRAERPGIARSAAAPSSAIVFHSPQESHLPCQRPHVAPQFWQMKEAVFLAINLISLRQRLEWVRVADSDGAKVPHVRGEQYKLVPLRRRGDSNVGEPRI